MLRVMKMSGKWYGINSDLTDDDEIKNIEVFVSEGTPIILVNDLSDLEDLGIDASEVEMVK